MANRINCYVCNIALIPRAMVRIAGDINEQKQQIAIHRRDNLNLPALEIQENTRLCFNCNRLINYEIQELAQNPESLRLNVLRQTRNSSCLICDNLENLHRLSLACRVNIFVLKNIYVPESVRCCNHHLDEKGYLPRLLQDGLQFINRPYHLHGLQLQNFLQGLRESATRPDLDFNDEQSFTEDEFRSISPITREQFQDLFTYCDPVLEPNQGIRRYINKKDLLTFLCKLRQSLSDDFLKVIFRYSSRQQVSMVIATVRKSLLIRFVPENIGVNCITREAYINRHVTEFTNHLYNPQPENPVAIAYIDGTYTYIAKSSNFQALRQSFSMHKHRHLIKPALIVAPDGFILDIHGPYFADSRNNDAAMLQNEFDRDANELGEWFREGDIFIIDRGYADAIPLLDRLGINHRMPHFLQHGQKQFTTEEANDCRLITKTRWIVEARNGHIKSIFKFFEGIIGFDHAVNILDFYRIAGAILNKYRDPILMEGANAELARQMLEKYRRPNVLQRRVEQENLKRRDARWVRLNEFHAPLFPILTLEYLQELTVGIYQLGLAPSYIQDKLQREGTEVFEFDELQNEEGLIRVRIGSRFRNNTIHQLWVSFQVRNENECENEDYNPIQSYYCTCKSGARTLGMCAHVASILWYLGYARHQPQVKYPTTALLDKVKDAAHQHD